jgi:N-acetylated-alpha-linked acidic dipeptidase
MVVIGNHRDAWGFGAGDPSLGSSVLLEVARGLGKSLAMGWRPRRTILLCSWDGEEYALVGSVEFTELYEYLFRYQVRGIPILL